MVGGKQLAPDRMAGSNHLEVCIQKGIEAGETHLVWFSGREVH